MLGQRASADVSPTEPRYMGFLEEVCFRGESTPSPHTGMASKKSLCACEDTVLRHFVEKPTNPGALGMEPKGLHPDIRGLFESFKAPC